MCRVEVGIGIIAGAAVVLGISALLVVFGLAPRVILTVGTGLYLIGFVSGCIVLETRK